MKKLEISKAFTLIESGPVVLITTNDGKKNNVMTISWTMVMDFTPVFAITTGAWNYSYAALRKSKECVISIPTIDLIDRVVGIGTGAPDQGMPGQYRMQGGGHRYKAQHRRAGRPLCIRRCFPQGEENPSRRRRRHLHRGWPKDQ
jgi:flavin reductase (DIM6/NTAB) family NADH-FMN oxidoreductase RutF